MGNWNPEVMFEIGQAVYQERLARAEAASRLPARAGGRSPRVALATALVTLARAVAPAPTAGARPRAAAR